MREALLILNILLVTVFSAQSQTDITAAIVANPGFEDGTTNWQLNNSGNASANLSISSDAAVGNSAAKVEVTKGVETNLVVLKNALTQNISEFAGNVLTVSFKVKVMEIVDKNNIILRINFFDAGGNILSNQHVQTQFWNSSFTKGAFTTLSQNQTIPENAAKLQIEFWCGKTSNTYYIDDIRVIKNTNANEENNPQSSENNVLNVVTATDGRTVFNTSNLQKLTFNLGELNVYDSNGSSHSFNLADILSLNFRKYPVLTTVSQIVDSKEKEILLYPNPAYDRLYFKSDFSKSHEARVEILNMEGKILLSERISAYDNSINISGITPEVYICRIYSRDKVSSSIFIKK